MTTKDDFFGVSEQGIRLHFYTIVGASLLQQSCLLFIFLSLYIRCCAIRDCLHSDLDFDIFLEYEFCDCLYEFCDCLHGGRTNLPSFPISVLPGVHKAVRNDVDKVIIFSIFRNVIIFMAKGLTFLFTLKTFLLSSKCLWSQILEIKQSC